MKSGKTCTASSATSTATTTTTGGAHIRGNARNEWLTGHYARAHAQQMQYGSRIAVVGVTIVSGAQFI